MVVQYCSEKATGKRVERKPARKKYKAAKARSRLEVTFGTVKVSKAAVNGVGNIDTLLRTCAAKGRNFQNRHLDPASFLVVFENIPIGSTAQYRGEAHHFTVHLH